MPQLLAGSTAIDLAAPEGIAMMGYGRRNGVATGTHDPLHAKALVLSAGDTQWAIVVVDLLCFSQEWCDPIADRVARETDIPKDNIWICATHTHSAPYFNLWKAHTDADVVTKAGRDMQWEVDVQARIADALIAAWNARQPAQIGFGQSETQIGANRRCPTADGGVRLIPYDEGPVDTSVSVMSIRTADDAPLALFINHACHGVVLTEDNLEYSADWLGHCAAALAEDCAPDGIAIITQGACGNIDPIQRGNFTLAEQAGRQVADACRRCLPDIRHSSDVTLEPHNQALTLPLKDTAAEVTRGEAHVAQVERNIERHVAPTSTHTKRLQDELALAHEGLEAARAAHQHNARFSRADMAAGTLACTLRMLRINDHALVGIPGEPFTELSLAVRASLDTLPAFVLGYCHDYIGYIPTEAAYEQGGYEVMSSRLAPGGHERIRETITAVLSPAARRP